MQTPMKVAILSNEVNCDKDLIENAVLALLIVNIDNLPVGLYDEIFKAWVWMSVHLNHRLYLFQLLPGQLLVR